MKKIKLGIIGSGFIAKEFMINISFLQKEIEIIAIYSRTFENATNFAKKFNIKNVCQSFESLLNQDVDAIYIASHNDSHFDYAIKALSAGKHILCEKPAGINTKELKEMINLASSKNLIFMEAMRLLYLPTYIKLKDLLKTKIFGEIISINASLGRISSRAYRHTKEMCGGALLDLGIYPLYAIIDILGTPKKIKANSLLNEERVDKATEAILKYENTLASFYVSFVSKTLGILRILCEKGTITIASYFTESSKIILEDKQGNIEEINFEIKSSGLYYEIKYFIDLINGKETNQNHQIAQNVIQVLDKIRYSQNILLKDEI